MTFSDSYLLFGCLTLLLLVIVGFMEGELDFRTSPLDSTAMLLGMVVMSVIWPLGWLGSLLFIFWPTKVPTDPDPDEDEWD